MSPTDPPRRDWPRLAQGVMARLKRWTGQVSRTHQTPQAARRGPVNHVVILDGTMSTLTTGCETNAGLTFKLLNERAPAADLSVKYEAGIQWNSWREMRDVIEGRGINRQIRRSYGWLASRYRPGDRIFLLGYSRGAYAVRSLAGIIDRVGLLKQECATERNVETAYRHYQREPDTEAARAFARSRCHETIEIQMIGAWDTVKALGVRAPILWRFTEMRHEFHDHSLGRATRHGYHALALHETRTAYTPVLWEQPGDWPHTCQQVWFRGSHGDVGGQLAGVAPARPLANVPLVWMLERAERCGLTLPEGWRARYPCDPLAPSVGSRRGWAKIFSGAWPACGGA